MRRKIVKQGAATMMISLPSKWIKKHNLSKGDELEIEERDGSVVLSLEPSKHKREVTINLSSLTESSIRTLITNAYRIGYDRIKLNFSHKSVLDVIKEVVEKNLLGFEIIKATENSCEMESVTEPSSDQFANIFSKVFLNIDELFIISENMLKGEKHEFEDIERNIQKYDNFCRRVISKGQLQAEGTLLWTFHNELIHAQREIYFLLRYLSKNKVKSNKEIDLLLKSCKKIFDVLKEGYQKKEISSLERVHEIDKEIAKEALHLMQKEKNSIVAHYIYSAARTFYLASSPLMAVLLA